MFDELSTSLEELRWRHGNHGTIDTTKLAEIRETSLRERIRNCVEYVLPETTGRGHRTEALKCENKSVTTNELGIGMRTV